MIAPHQFPLQADSDATAPRLQHPLRLVVAVLAITTILLAGALYRSTRPAPSNAADVYQQWVSSMDMAVEPGRNAWNTRFSIANGPYAANQSAESMLVGVSLGGNRDPKLQHLINYLAGINRDLDRMLTSTMSDRSGNVLRRDARYVRSTLRDDVLIPLAGRGHALYVEGRLPTTDAAAESLSVQVCRVQVAVVVREYARFFASGLPESRAQMLNDCAHGYPLLY